MTNPLGKYAVLVAVGTASLAILLAFAQHFAFAMDWTVNNPDTFIDNIAILAIGIIFGGAGGLVTLNGTVKRAEQNSRDIAVLAAATANVAQIGDKVVVVK